MGKSLKGKELGKGLSQRPDGTFEGRFVDRFGKRRSVYGKTITEVTKRLRDAQAADDSMLNVVDPNVTLDKWFETCINVYKSQCRNTSIATYNVLYNNNLRPLLGHRRIKDINLVMLQTIFNQMKSDNMRKRCRALLVDIFKKAIQSDLLVKNAAEGIKTNIANEDREEKRALTDKEVEQFLEQVKKTDYLYHVTVIGLETGMRIGEILGLTWDCVDFDKEEIYIKQTLTHLGTKNGTVYELHKPKTKAGVRMIPMNKKVKEVLLQQKERKRRIDEKCQPPQDMPNLVFATRNNRPIDDRNIRLSIEYFVARYNKKHPEEPMDCFSPHSLRHTFTSNCIKRGIPPKVIQKILGHASIDMTMNVYYHVDNETIKNEMKALEENGVKMA